jgi:hypothetical protein
MSIKAHLLLKRKLLSLLSKFRLLILLCKAVDSAVVLEKLCCHWLMTAVAISVCNQRIERILIHLQHRPGTGIFFHNSSMFFARYDTLAPPPSTRYSLLEKHVHLDAIL